MSMVWIAQHRLAVEVPEGLGDAIIEGLSKDYKPLISEIKRGYWERLGLKLDRSSAPIYLEQEVYETLFPDREVLIGGEIFIRADGSFHYLKIPSWDEIEIGCISPQASNIDDYWKFCEAVLHIITEVTGKKDLKWELVTAVNQNFWQASKTMEEVSPTELDFKASVELENKEGHQLLKKIRDVNNILLNKLMDVENREDVQKLIQKFEGMGLIIKDFVVFCKQHGQQIFRVNSKSAIEEASEKGFSCFLCGKAISDERIDELITCSDFGKTLMDRNYWMPVRLIQALQKLGIKPTQYFIDFGEGDEDIDLFLVHNNRLLMFEMTDRKFSLKHAFLFSAKNATFDVDSAILISTEKVPVLMQQHLQQANQDTDLKFIEGFHGLDASIEAILIEKQRESITSIIEDFVCLTSVNLQGLLLKSINPNYKDIEMEKKPDMAHDDQEKPKKKKKKKKKKDKDGVVLAEAIKEV
mgnify:FL=1